MEYYIYITNRCNMNCSYCSVMMRAGKTVLPDEISYPLENLKTFVDQTQKTRFPNDDTAIIYFFGGEPSLDYDKIIEIIALFQDVEAYKVKFVLHTNGLLLDRIPEKVITKIHVIFLSLNYEKALSNGQITPYFSKAIQTITQIKKNYNLITIGRLTISEQTSLYTEATMSSLFFDYIYWQLDNQKELSDITTYKTRYKDNVELLFQHWLGYLEQGVILRYIPFLSVIRHLLNPITNLRHAFCGYGDDIVYIQTDGSCHGCCDDIENEPHRVGDIAKGINFSGMELSSKTCLECSYLNLCGGRCGRMHQDFSKDRIKDFCEMNIFMFDLIKKSIPAIKKQMNRYPEILNAFYDENIEFTEQIP